MQEIGDLHSMAYHSSDHTYDSLSWDHPHSYGVFNADHFSPYMENSEFSSSDFDSGLSSGYLQDALVEFHDRSKRRRLLLYTEDQPNNLNVHVKNYWNSNFNWDMFENLNCLSHVTKTPIDEASPLKSKVSEEEDRSDEHEEALYSSSQEYSCKDNSTNYITSSYSMKPSVLSGASSEEKRTKSCNMYSRMVYPFELVKPGGVEGEVTLNDINERIQMRPTRPVRHPVGDFACRPFVSENGAAGLSGKAVVALTRIHTQGRGTITIIRTKG